MYKEFLKMFMLLVFCLLFQQAAWAGFDFDDLELIEQSEQEELLELAKQAASNWHFSSARSYLSQAEEKDYSPDAIDETKRVIGKHREAYRENERRKEEERRLAEAERQRQNQASSGNVYITSWGYDFSDGDKIWGRTGVKLSNGSTLYTWLNRMSGCYTVTVAGGYHGSGSNCGDSINGSWSVNACSSGQFLVQGDQADVVKAIVGRCS